MARESVLIVEDDPDIEELVRYNLSREGYRVTAVRSGEEAVRSARAAPPDLVLLDLMLPGLDGLEVCRVLKADAATCRIPVVMLTAKGEEADIVAGLEVGGDDYIVKPFSPRVLLARIRAALRRTRRGQPDEDAVIRIQNLKIDPGRREVAVEGQRVELTFSEFQILHLLARRPGWVFTRSQIVDAVRGDEYPVTDRSVDVHIVSLRRKLGAAGKLIETVRGVGYRFRE